jgi:zinc transporter ZupT
VSYQLIYFGFNFHLATVQEDHSDHADDHHDDHGMTGLHDDHDDVSALPSYILMHYFVPTAINTNSRTLTYLHPLFQHDQHDEHLHGAQTMSAESKTVNSVWGAVIGATLLVNLATFSGVLILMVPAVQRGYLKYRGIPGTPEAVTGKGGRMLDIFVPGFAVGALIATSVFLILPEALMYIGGGHDDHGDGHDDHSDHDGHRFLQDGHDDHDDDNEEGANAAKFGCSILGGFLLPLFFSILFHIPDEDVQTQAQGEKKIVEGDSVSPKADAETGVVVAAGGEDATSVEASVIKSFVNKKLCATILLGDCFHNFSDGLFIAAAFRSCSQTLAIGIMLVTLAHEIPQELADFVILTQYAGLSVRKALLFNFVSGLSVLLGGIIFLASNPGAEATGVILAMGGGVYLNAAACETIPRMEPAMKIRWDRALMLISIIVGAVPIGLILIDHKHCG